MSNVFEKVAGWVKNSSIVIWIFLASLAMFLIGINHFIEDTLSSRYGLQQLEAILGLVPTSYPLTYWTMSLAPQVAQVIFTYVFLSDTEKNRWAAGAMGLAFLIDFAADAWYRSGQGLFNSPGVFLASIALTLVYFTIGSEGFITVGIGIVLELAPAFIVQFKKFANEILSAIFSSPKGGQPQGQQQQQKPNQPQQQQQGKPQNQQPFQHRPAPPGFQPLQKPKEQQRR